MKKILLLIIISISIFSAKAQITKNRSENTQYKSPQLAVNSSFTDGIIDNVSVYPNPVVDELKISFKSSQRSSVVISLFNNIGKPVFKQQSEVDAGNTIISIDIRSKSLEPGVYFVKLLAENQTITRKLIVK